MREQRREDKNGRWHLSQKGYPRYHTGPHRNRYVHRVRMEQHLGRKLKPDEDIHHRNGCRWDFRLRNLRLMSHREHSFISAKQRWYVTNVVEPERKKQWDSYFDSNAQHQQVAL